MISNINKKSISLMLLNARITKKSFKRWKKFVFFAKSMFQKFDICLSSNNESKKYLKFLGAKKIKYIGNLKFSQTEKDEHFLNNNLKKFLLSRRVWCAASTHPTEETLSALAHKKLKKEYKNLLTIIIPRHINRTDQIINEMEKLNLKFHVHGSEKKIHKDTDIYLVDSYGQTKSFFKLCKIVFLGGSIIKHGGQNPLEAARYGCKIIYGPNISNFYEIYKLLNKYKVSTKIIGLNQMINNIDRIFKNKTVTFKIKSKIKELGNEILSSTLKEINFLINRK
jgi:3-deoxy-D-manno-octulosonic-acid transferase